MEDWRHFGLERRDGTQKRILSSLSLYPFKHLLCMCEYFSSLDYIVNYLNSTQHTTATQKVLRILDTVIFIDAQGAGTLPNSYNNNDRVLCSVQA
jgi:hypothetical protein